MENPSFVSKILLEYGLSCSFSLHMHESFSLNSRGLSISYLWIILWSCELTKACFSWILSVVRSNLAIGRFDLSKYCYTYFFFNFCSAGTLSSKCLVVYYLRYFDLAYWFISLTILFSPSSILLLSDWCSLRKA